MRSNLFHMQIFLMIFPLHEPPLQASSISIYREYEIGLLTQNGISCRKQRFGQFASNLPSHSREKKVLKASNCRFLGIFYESMDYTFRKNGCQLYSSLQWNTDFSNTRFLEPPDNSNQASFLLDLLHSNTVISHQI